MSSARASYTTARDTFANPTPHSRRDRERRSSPLDPRAKENVRTVRWVHGSQPGFNPAPPNTF